MRFEYLISEWGKQLSMERKMMRDCWVPRILALGRGMKASIQEDTHNNLEAQKGGGAFIVRPHNPLKLLYNTIVNILTPHPANLLRHFLSLNQLFCS